MLICPLLVPPQDFPSRECQISFKNKEGNSWPGEWGVNMGLFSHFFPVFCHLNLLQGQETNTGLFHFQKVLKHKEENNNKRSKMRNEIIELIRKRIIIMMNWK